MESERVVGLERRRAMALGAWSAAVAGVGTVVARLRTGASGNPSTVRTAAGSTRWSRDRVVTTPTSEAASSAATATTSAAAAAPVPSAAGGAGLLSGDALVLHVARRLSFGPTPELLAEVRATGVDTWIEQQLRPAGDDDEGLAQLLARLPDLQTQPGQFRTMRRGGPEVIADLRLAAVLRAVSSRFQLHEVMVDLWHDHLAASASKAGVEYFLPQYDRDVIRPFALGRFADLLKAATKSGAMLGFLDTADSMASMPNENHGRELLELHTVGREAGYTQVDVDSAARVLSGWTFDANGGAVVFDPARHHPGPATVLGWSTPGTSGPAAAGEVDRLLDHLAHHPMTAQRVARLLARRFIADAPSEAVVADIAAAYLGNGTDIAATLRHLFAGTAFRSGGGVLVRRPFDVLAASLRATGAREQVPNIIERLVPLGEVAERAGLGDALDPLLSGLAPITDVLDRVLAPVLVGASPPRPISGAFDTVLVLGGQRLFEAPTPAGYPLGAERWATGSALLRRWTMAADIARAILPGIDVDAGALSSAPDLATMVDQISVRCFGVVASAATREGAIEVANMPVNVAPEHERQARAQNALAFLLAAPEMQLR